MLAVLTVIILLFLIFLVQGKTVRESIVTGLLLWSVLALLSIEILNLFCRIDYLHLVLFWTVIGLVCLGIAVAKRSCLGDIFRKVPSTILNTSDIVLLFGLTIILFGTVVIALVAPPNTWDSMTYHLARVSHWIQNKSVGHYPTSMLWQIAYPPFAEFCILHTVILAGNDFLANLVQWVAMVGSLACVSLIVKDLGGDDRTQTIAAVFAATVPMAIVQASSTQNDLTASFFLTCFVCFGLRTISDDGHQSKTTSALKTGAALGLAILTKGTACLVAFPFAVWFAVAGLRRSGVGFAKHIVLVGVISLAINAGHFYRNQSLFGVFFGAQEITTMESNETMSIRVTASNLLKNLSLNICTPSKTINAGIQNAMERFITAIGGDINDSGTSFKQMPFKVVRLNIHEDFAGAPFHVVLIALGLILNLIWRRRLTSDILWYSMCLVVGILLFCAVLRWQPWGARRQLPVFILAAPWAALVLYGVFNRRTNTAIAGVLLVASMPVLFCNYSRPLVGYFLYDPPSFIFHNIFQQSRKELYFRADPHLRAPYEAAAKYIAAKKPHTVGLKIGWNFWEYPLWVMLSDLTERPVVIKHVNVPNESKRARTCLELKDPPEIIFAHPPAGNEIFLERYGVGYTKVWSNGYVSLYSIVQD